jgi:hypothetical protein
LVWIIYEVSKKKNTALRARIPFYGAPHGSRNVGYGNGRPSGWDSGATIPQINQTFTSFSAACLAVPLILTFLGL